MPKYIWQRKGWPGFTWDSGKLLAALSECRKRQGKLLALVENLGLKTAREVRSEAVIREALATAEIEGVRLDPQVVRSSVARRLGLPDAGLPEPDRNVEGLVDVLFDAAEKYEEELDEQRLFGWHAALFPTGYSGMKRINVAAWRDMDEPMRVVSGPVGRETVHFVAPPNDLVPAAMDAFFAWWRASRGKTDGLLRAGVAHLYVVTIHPFEDGNGRIARALTDMAMAQDEASAPRGYSLSAQMRGERREYYDALEAAQKGGLDITEWLLWFLGCFTRALDRSEAHIEQASLVQRFWRRLEGASLNPRQRKVLNKLLEMRPHGFEGGLSNKKYRSMTKTSQATAARDLAELVDSGALIKTGAGRSVRYELSTAGNV